MPKTINNDFATFKLHFPEEQSKSLANFANDVALKRSRYIFTSRVGKKQFGYCTYCNEEFQTFDLKHKSKFTCTKCKSSCEVRTAGLSRKYMEDRAALVWYERSKINPKAITARVIKLYRDYSGDYKTVTTQYNCCHMYLFEPGNSEYYILGWGGKWEKRKKVFSSFDNHLSNNGYCGVGWNKFMSLSNIKRAVKGTPFQYSTWGHYVTYKNPRYVSDMTEFFDLAARYPCIEYLTKLGLQSLVWAKLYRETTHGAIHWRGKTLQKVLKLPTKSINELRGFKWTISPLFVKYMQISNIDKSDLAATEIHDLEKNYANDKKDLITVLKYTTLKKAYTYLKKQHSKQKAKEHYSSRSEVLTTWRDYIKDCIILEMDLQQEALLFPADLYSAHQDTIAKVTYKFDFALNEKIKKRLEALIKYNYEYGGFIVRPALDSVELMREGNALKHCVGGYAKRYAEGEIDLLVLRKADDPNKPFYTMEIRNERIGHGTIKTISQCRGLKNCMPTPEVKAFMDMFIAKRFLPKKRAKTSTRNTNRAEAAV